MVTHLPQNQFISNPSVTPEPPTEGPAVASSDLQPRATAEPISQSALASAMTADAAAGPEFADPPVPAAVIFSEPPSNEGRPSGTPASAPSKNPDVGVLDAIDCIHEIFHYARKLMRGHQGFVLDEPAFMADVEEEPLFIRDGAHLRRWEA